MNESYNKTLVNGFPKYLQSNIYELCKMGGIGLANISINDISTVPNKQYITETDINNYHFAFNIPYAGKKLKWEVIFDPEDNYFAPDFDFNDDYFLSNPDVTLIEENVPSLKDWDVTDSQTLIRVLNEFLQLYKQSHLQILAADDSYLNVKEEYEALIEKGISPGDIEIYVDPNIVYMVIAIQVNSSQLPVLEQSDTAELVKPGKDYINLRLSFPNMDRSKLVAHLFLSPRFEQILGNNKVFQIPEFKKDVKIIDYYNSLKRLISDKIKLYVKNYQLRKQFMSAIVALASQYLLEYDCDNFTRCVFYVPLGDDKYIVEVSTEPQFPVRKPKVFLYQECTKEECKEQIKNIPWRLNNGNAEELAKIFIRSLGEELPRAKNAHKHH